MPITQNRPVIQMDLQGNFIAEYPTAKAAAKQFGGRVSDRQKIYDKCQINRPKKNNIAFGFKWEFKENSILSKQ